MKVYILQEIDEDDVPNANVYLSKEAATHHAADLMEYGNLTIDAWDECDDPSALDQWDGEEDLSFYDNEGAVVLRLYSVEVK